ncbi:MAG: hypothetical protein ACRC2H_04200, partial [Silanimonas sp.]
MTESRRQRLQWIAAVLWGAVVIAVAAGLAAFLRAPALDTDVLALLPRDEASARVEQAAASALAGSTDEVLVLLRSDDAEAARNGAAMLRAVLRARAVALDEVEAPLPEAEALAALGPWRRRLLADNLRAQLDTRSPEEWASAALARLYAPMAFGPGPDALDDPLGLAAAWWQARARGISRVDGEWVLRSAQGDALLLRFRSRGGAFRVDGGTPLADALADAQARIAATAAADSGARVELLAAGVPLIAEAAAAQASREMGT